MRPFLVSVFLSLSSALSAQNIPDTFRAVNSPYDEQNPVLSPDGKTLFFTIGNHPSNTGGKKDPGDIWISERQGLTWTTPVHGGSGLNDGGYNAVVGLSPSGNQLFLHGHYDPSGSIAKSQGIAVSKRRGEEWSRPENIYIPYYINKSRLLCGAISEDNTVFVFSAESYGTFGVEDLYVSLKEGNKWSEPKNLGITINTQFQELSPSLSADKKTLYFSSNGRSGSGSFDVYSASRLDDSWTQWSTPVNLGPGINSEGRELFFRFYNPLGFALYTSTTSSDGYGDLKIYAPREGPLVKDTVIYASLDADKKENLTTLLADRITSDASTGNVVPEKIPEEKHRVKVYGKITNAKTGEVIRARISFAGPGKEEHHVVSAGDGYSIAVPSMDYTVRIEASGYISTLEKLDINSFDMRDLEMNFGLQPVEVGTTVNLENVLFAQAKTDILPESFPELDLVVSFLKENPKVRIELRGHTDGRGVHADNVRLSQQRVNKVKAYLVSRGIEPRRISGKGFGGSKPIASNDTEESRRMNRRVEFVIKKY
jgi:OOP family OmpA-OmpF porin